MRAAAIVAAAALLVVAGGALMLERALSQPYAGFSGPVVYHYEVGTSGGEAAADLEARGVVRSRWLFLLGRALEGGDLLQAGEYEFAAPASILEVLDKLVEGRVRLHAITFPEGLNRFEVAERVGASRFGTAERFLALTEDAAPVRDLFPEAKTLEGCLFPETYLLPATAGERDLLDAMLSRFRSELAAASAQKTTPLNPYEALILASMIEKETGVAEERPLVSSVFHNRLRIGMRMQCDPTVIYGLVVENRYRGNLYEADLESPTPYNTYVHSGLPPGPIASPGRGCLEAAHRPPESEYLYFVARREGEPDHVFSASLAEHNRAVTAYRKTKP